MNYLIAIDPGSTSGIVAMTIEMVPKLVWREVWKKKDGELPTDIIKHGLHCVQYAVIEDQYLGKNANSMKILTRIGGRWEEACANNGLDVKWIPPKTWQTKILGRGNMKRDQIDKMMKLVARQDTGIKLTADECAAWCIGKCAIGARGRR